MRISWKSVYCSDPDQTIYTWRGANVRYLLDFDRAFPGAKTIMMMQNYRSTPQILQVSNSLISQNQERMRKELLPMLPAGESVVCHFADTAEKNRNGLRSRYSTYMRKEYIIKILPYFTGHIMLPEQLRKLF